MFTVCPKCTLTLAVTANDLRIGQGYVRCGRCSNVFNALLQLSDTPAESDTATPPPPANPASTSQITRALSSQGLQPAPAAPSAGSPASPRPAGVAPPRPANPAPARPADPAPSRTTDRAPARPPDCVPPRPAGVAPARPAEPAPARPPAAEPPSPAPASAAPRSTAARRADADAVENFEMVLETLGINLEEETASSPETIWSDGSADVSDGGMDVPPEEPYVESIVLEGDDVVQLRAPHDTPVDELDLLTRRLNTSADGTAAGGGGPSAKGAAPAGDSVAGHAAADRAAAAGHAARRTGADPRGDVRADVHTGRGMAVGRLSGAAAAQPPAGAPIDAAAATGASGAGTPVSGSPMAGLPPDLDVPALRPAWSAPRSLWLTACVALAILLGLQVVNHWRDALANTATIGPPLQHLYATLGVPLRPHWDLDAYDVRQEGAQSDAAVIHVRLSLANHAPRAQPVPLLRLTLLDRYGRRIAQRDLAPRDYWPPGRAPQRWLASDERIDSEVAVRDPGADSASFELDVCLRDATGAVRCAGDGRQPPASGADAGNAQ